jgi:hypothetical protein
MSNRGKAYRRWKTFSKYVSRIKKRLYYMKVQYGEVDTTSTNGKVFKRKLWRSPESWKEVDEKGSTYSKSLKDTPTPYKDPWKKVDDKRRIKELRDESKRIIDERINEELNNELKD